MPSLLLGLAAARRIGSSCVRPLNDNDRLIVRLSQVDPCMALLGRDREHREIHGMT